MIITAIVATAFAWYIGGVMGTNINSDNTMGISVSTLFAIVTMGGFILKAIKDGNSGTGNNKK